MWLLSLISFLLLGGFLLLSAMRFGVPDMVSDTYYQLQGTTGSEVLGGKVKRNFGWVFSVVMVLVAFLMMTAILDLGRGVQCLAFVGCGGLAFVGCAPNYLGDESKVHKIAALVAAAGCVGWCLSVCWWVTAIIAILYILYVAYAFHLYEELAISKRHWLAKPWYWLEVSAFLDVFLTYWIIY
jgi:hypothetical protein|nr:hypothetical protein [uncultured Prevotella sp.]DAV54982.1 MAG TPA: hypothetical protein [Caudoviricetes sp.]